MISLLYILGVLLIVFWLVQIVSLMRMTDDQFPGRLDKLIWAGILLFGLVLGAFAFLIWKLARRPDVIADQLNSLIQPPQGRKEQG